MYADRVEAELDRSVKDRLRGNFRDDSARKRQITGKRPRQDDKWEHDLYEDNAPSSNRNVGVRDLRLKLQRKGLQPASKSGNGSVSSVRDLREKLSGTVNPQYRNADTSKPKSLPESVKQAKKSVAVDASVPDSKKVSNPPRKKAQKKESVDDFLQSLGLEKYSITFQAEEIDMAALLHMTDEDLKALGIPMGPRKKIILELDARR